MVCAAYAANVLENALVTMGHEARERAFAQVDELLAEYSQWPFARRTGGTQGIGANIGSAIAEEVEKNKDKELQLEVSQMVLTAAHCTDGKPGHCSLFERIHTIRFVTVTGRRWYDLALA